MGSFVFIYQRKVLCTGLYGLNRWNKAQARFFTTELNESESQDISRVPNQNKSRLLNQNRNVLLKQVPYSEPHSWIHNTEKYQRKIFGRYGLASGIDPRICFEVKERSDNIHNASEQYSLQQLLSMQKAKTIAQQEAVERRESAIAAKLEKLEQWKLEMRNKVAKKEADALAAKQNKQRMIEEVRRHFGFKVDPRDERFKEMLEQKEREEKKRQKEAKKKAKEDKMMARIVGSTSTNAHS
ncbi:unnamed protein product [Ceratitis capitata]|uniref:Large ribosomal subunit protein mL64 n=2 Tax=Ceratitis capitata TaxID=7213 RepID=A0A811V0C2_CERCA|nr:unnamed protein product [Ceratitis capitata]